MNTHPLSGRLRASDPTIVRFSAPSAEGETKTHAGSIGAALLERAKELVNISTGRPPHSSWISMSTRSALAPTLSVTVVRGRVNLKAFCRRFPDHRREDLSVSLDRHAVFDRHHDQSDATGVRVQCRGRCDFFDESGNEELLSILNALRETDLRERTSDERV